MSRTRKRKKQWDDFEAEDDYSRRQKTDHREEKKRRNKDKFKNLEYSDSIDEDVTPYLGYSQVSSNLGKY